MGAGRVFQSQWVPPGVVGKAPLHTVGLRAKGKAGEGILRRLSEHLESDKGLAWLVLKIRKQAPQEHIKRATNQAVQSDPASRAPTPLC